MGRQDSPFIQPQEEEDSFMLNRPECITCVLEDLVAASRSAGLSEPQIYDVLRKAMASLATTYSAEDLPSYAITEVHRLLKRTLNESVLFQERRQIANEVCIEVARLVYEEVKCFPDDKRLYSLVRWAIAGNSMDFRTVGTGYDFGPEDVKRYLSKFVSEDLLIDDIPSLISLVSEGPRHIVYILDNVGEVAFDRLLMQELESRGSRVTAVCKTGAITSDAIKDDAISVGIDTTASKLITSGGETLGISYKEMSPTFRSELLKADVIISKGQANFYAMTHPMEGIKADIFCLLTLKCMAAAHLLGLDSRGPVGVHVSMRAAGGR